MEISPYQVRNVLRTYGPLIKSKSDRTDHEGKKEVTAQEEGTSSIDKVTISHQSRERLKEEDHLTQIDSPSPIDEE